MITGTSKLAGYIVIGALAALGVYMFLVTPALSRVADLSAEERATRAEVNRLDQQILAYRTAQSDLSRATGKDLLYSTFVNDKKLYLPIEEMERAARITGSNYDLKILRDTLVEAAPVKKNAKTAARVTKAGTLEEIPYTLVIKNRSYLDVVYFMQYLERIPHFTEVSKIDMLYIENPETEISEMNVTINGVFLAVKDDVAKKPAATAPAEGTSENSN